MNVPAAALRTYEQLRAEVVSGQARAEGLTAIVYHGMVAVILTEVAQEVPSSAPRLPAASEKPIDRELLRLIANMVLQSQAEVMHVY
jgi:hypothetical protein